MSNIRDYLKEREKRQQTEKTTGYREKIRGHKLAILQGSAWSYFGCSCAVLFYISVEE